MKYKLFENTELVLYYDTSSERWYLKNLVNSNVYDLSSASNFSSFLKIFYEDPSTFISNIAEKAKESNINEGIIKTLPVKRSIIFCIENRMFFWVELSLKWLEFISIDQELRESINSVIKDSKSPQTLRHKLIKLLNKKNKGTSE